MSGLGYASEIINNKNIDPVVEILSITQEKSNYGRELNKLSGSEKVIYIVGELEGEINNGGFTQYLLNSSRKNAQEAVSILNSIGAKYTASLVENAIKIYGDGPNNDDEDSIDLTDEQEEKLNNLDSKFYEYNDNLNELQINFIKKNLMDFKE